MKLLWCVLCVVFTLPASAKPDMNKKVERSWLTEGSALYQFEQHRLKSVDQQRTYRITLAKPLAPAPKRGYPVIYLLDGNAALAALNDRILAGMTGGDWPVVVAVGYDTDLYFDFAARAYDYTFKPLLPVTDGRQYGGAEVFWQFMEQQVKPWVQAQVPLNAKRQTLWGHSFGGLFVLNTLFNHSDSYQRYVAADPSLWWQNGLALQYERACLRHLHQAQATVLIQRSHSNRSASQLADDAVRQFAKRLSMQPHLVVEYHEYFAQSHGSLLAHSLPEALRMAQR